MKKNSEDKKPVEKISKTSLDYQKIVNILHNQGLHKGESKYSREYDRLSSMCIFLNNHLQKAKDGKIKPNSEAIAKIKELSEYKTLYENKVKFKAITDKLIQLVNQSWKGDKKVYYEQNLALNNYFVVLEKSFNKLLEDLNLEKLRY